MARTTTAPTTQTMKIIPGLVATLHCLLQLQHMLHSLWSPIFTDPEKVKGCQPLHCVTSSWQSPAGLDHAGPGHLVHEVDQLHRLVLLLLLAHPLERARTRFFFATSHRVDLNEMGVNQNERFLNIFISLIRYRQGMNTLCLFSLYSSVSLSSSSLYSASFPLNRIFS